MFCIPFIQIPLQYERGNSWRPFLLLHLRIGGASTEVKNSFLKAQAERILFFNLSTKIYFLLEQIRQSGKIKRLPHYNFETSSVFIISAILGKKFPVIFHHFFGKAKTPFASETANPILFVP